jgi:hypothetical protein
MGDAAVHKSLIERASVAENVLDAHREHEQQVIELRTLLRDLEVPADRAAQQVLRSHLVDALHYLRAAVAMLHDNPTPHARYLGDVRDGTMAILRAVQAIDGGDSERGG